MTRLLALALLAVGAAAPQSRDDCVAGIERFLELLSAYRSGEGALASDLAQSAESLCRDCARCDARAIATFYMSLSREARQAGVDADALFLELYDAVLEAGRAGLAADAWARERASLVARLRDLAQRARLEPDFVPAARALSLIARIEVERIQVDPELAPEGQAQLAAQASSDAAEALQLFELAGQRTPQLEPLWLMARLDLARGAFAQSRVGFEEVEARAGAVGNVDFREHGLRGRVDLARQAGDARGIDHLLSELASFRDPRSSWPLARDWAERLLADEHAEEALDFLERTRPGEDAHALDGLEWEFSYGAALLRLGELEEAREHLERAASAAPSEVALLALAQLALLEGRSFEVRALLEGDPARLANFSARGAAEAHRILGEDLLLEGEVEAAIAELEASLELAERWRAALAPRLGSGLLGAESVESVFGEWAGLHTLALLADALSRSGRPLEALRRLAEGHSRSLREARSDPARLRELAGAEPARVSSGDLAAWIRRGELGLLSWVIGSDFGVAVYAWDQGGSLRARAARLPYGRAAIADAARRVREAAVSGDEAWLAQEAAAVRRALLPVELRDALLQQLASHDPDARLLLLVHGPLERLAFELLPLEEGGPPLDQLATLSVLPGLPDAAPAPAASASELQAWSLLGAPPAEDGFPALPAAERELREIAAMHAGARLRCGAEFTSGELERALGEGRCLHVATHLVEPGREQDSVALLAANGGRLSARAVRELARPLPLVVLPACESGGGAFVDAEGLHGMARAFLASGTRSLVVTLWPVADEPARTFSVAFHRALLAGASPSAAVRAGRLELRAQGHGPAEWAAFRALGAD